MFKQNRERLQQALLSLGIELEGHVMIMNKSFTLPKWDDDCDYFPTKFDPYITWFTGVFYTDINMLLHLDTMELIAFYPKPSEEELCFIKYYGIDELKEFGVSSVIHDEDLVAYLKGKNVTQINFVRGKFRSLIIYKNNFK
jgi:hypothetical protein